MKNIKNIKLTNKIMSQLITSTDLFGKLNTLMARMDNPFLLTYLIESIDTISSNKIENIHSTLEDAMISVVSNDQASEYVRYREALKQSHKNLIINEIIRIKDLEWINSRIRGTSIGIRKTPVVIRDGEENIIAKGTPANEIMDQLDEIITLINEEWDMNSIVKALLIHHRFESVHPFADGNGRTGRILFALLLSKFNILDVPASVFSYTLNKYRKEYYKALSLADKGEDEKYLEIMLDILNKSLKISIEFSKEVIKKKNDVIESYKERSDKFLKVLNQIFFGIKFTPKYIVKKTKLNDKTIKKYLDELKDAGILSQEVKGKYKPYKNEVISKILYKYFKL